MNFLTDLGYKSSERDSKLQKIWEMIGDNYEVKPSPTGMPGNVIVIPDNIYWECNKLGSDSEFKQKWTNYRPSIFAKKHNLILKGSLIYNKTWYEKSVSGEAKNIYEKKEMMQKVIHNKASVDEVSKSLWKGKDLDNVGIFGIYYNGKLIELLFDEDMTGRSKSEFLVRKLQSLKKYDPKLCSVKIILTVKDLIRETGSRCWGKKDMIELCQILRFVMKPEFCGKSSIEFNFGDSVFVDGDEWDE